MLECLKKRFESNNIWRIKTTLKSRNTSKDPVQAIEKLKELHYYCAYKQSTKFDVFELNSDYKNDILINLQIIQVFNCFQKSFILNDFLTLLQFSNFSKFCNCCHFPTVTDPVWIEENHSNFNVYRKNQMTA